MLTQPNEFITPEELGRRLSEKYPGVLWRTSGDGASAGQDGIITRSTSLYSEPIQRILEPPSKGWVRYRFYADRDDYRPISWPPKGPYWCTGYGDGYSTVVAFLPQGEPITDWWPEASQIERTFVDGITYSGRFPKPDWWPVEPSESPQN